MPVPISPSSLHVHHSRIPQCWSQALTHLYFRGGDTAGEAAEVRALVSAGFATLTSGSVSIHAVYTSDVERELAMNFAER